MRKAWVVVLISTAALVLGYVLGRVHQKQKTKKDDLPEGENEPEELTE